MNGRGVPSPVFNRMARSHGWGAHMADAISTHSYYRTASRKHTGRLQGKYHPHPGTMPGAAAGMKAPPLTPPK